VASKEVAISTKFEKETFPLYSSLIIDSEHMQIFVRNFSGKSITFFVTSKCLVEELMMLIHEIEGIAVSCQRLIYSGKQLVIDRTLGDYNVLPASTLHLTSRLSGD